MDFTLMLRLDLLFLMLSVNLFGDFMVFVTKIQNNLMKNLIMGLYLSLIMIMIMIQYEKMSFINNFILIWLC